MKIPNPGHLFTAPPLSVFILYFLHFVIVLLILGYSVMGA
ncbi:unnamed protein product [Tuber melanosporum]|uniref:(Perigord truffle) hypothetical protein n=1 Tax=Tuber melanosporum (strain Mel28) TaxID=656061 RepID=D5G461_TUBMM|nr:uncharacterized protein GSTUM_00003964001 [Tuber melanosporum]CAZ79304.1 unnamed protein product [Tuber melanosporum]